MKMCLPSQSVGFVLIYVSVIVIIRGFHDLKCPTYSQWKLRARAVCNTSENYFCVFDINKKHFTEICQEKPVHDTAGYKVVLVGNIDGRECEDNRYQPFVFWTNGSDKCIFKKSYCNEEGQIVFKKGSTTLDRQCRCDYTRGYDFVKRPNNPCYCVPSVEDCSCYFKTCPKGSILTPDYKCILIDAWKASFQCDFISDVSKATITPAALERYLDDNQDIQYFGLQTSIGVSGFFILIVLVTGAVLLFSRCIHVLKSRTSADITVLQNIRELEKYGKEYWREQRNNFVETKATEYVWNTLKNKPSIMITGPPGCGKSSVAYYVAFKMEEYDEYDFVVITHPNDILKYTGTSKRRLFVIDDIFGHYAIHEHDVKWLVKLGEKVNNFLSRNSNIKIVMTSRTHLFKAVDVDKSKFSFTHVSLISDHLKLTTEESRKIANAYLPDDVIKKLDDNVISMYSCFPSLCAQLSFKEIKDPVEYFKCPFKFFDKEFEHFEKKSDVNFFTLALLVIQNNNIDKDFFNCENDEHDKLLKDLAKEIGCNNLPFKHMIHSSLKSMVDTYTKETESMYSFFTWEMFQIAACSIGKYIIETIVRYGKIEFIKNRFLIESLQNHHDSEFTIVLPKHLEQSYFDKLLREIKKGHICSVFTDNQNTYPNFRESFKNYLKKRLEEPVLKTDIGGLTVIHVVSNLGYSEYISVFTKLDQNLVKMKDNNGMSALHFACAAGYASTVEELIRNKANLDEPDKDENTPLDLAVNWRHYDVVRLLLSNKASIKQRKADLRTPLHTSCYNGNTEITKLLLDYKAKVDVSNEHGNTPLHIASKKGYVEIVHLLLEHKPEINNTNNKDRTPLLIACQNKNIDVVRLLLDKGANIENVDNEGKSPLHYACEIGCRTLVDLLISHSSNVKKCDNKGNTPLHYACFRGKQSIVEILFKHDVDINKNNKSMMTPLHYACQNGHDDVVFSLISQGVMVNNPDKHKRTPLHDCCRKGCLKIAERLLVNGADVNIRDENGVTPLFICCENTHSELATLLLKHKADLNTKNENGLTPLCAACIGDDKNIVCALLEYCPQINDADNIGRSPLYIACENGNIEIVMMLLKNNAEVNQADKEAKSPLHVASQKGCVEIIELLLKSKAYVNQLDNIGQTPLFKAVSEGHVAAVKLLVDNKAVVDIIDNSGKSLSYIASEIGDIDTASHLDCILKS